MENTDIINQQEKYRLYIDESGDHVFHDIETLAKPPHRFLALLGCIFCLKNYLLFQGKLEELKRTHFNHNPDEPLIFHRKEMVNCQGPFWRLRDIGFRDNFNQALLKTISEAKFGLILVVIDKLSYKNRYPDPFHPYHICLDFMLQRYAGLMNHYNRQGDVMAESRGKKENGLLANAYDHIYTHGDMHHDAGFYKRALTSREIKLKGKSANIAGLQLADILAYPLKQAYLAENGICEEAADTFGNLLVEAVSDKYNRHIYHKYVNGYGKVFFPK